MNPDLTSQKQLQARANIPNDIPVAIPSAVVPDCPNSTVFGASGFIIYGLNTEVDTP